MRCVARVLGGVAAAAAVVCAAINIILRMRMQAVRFYTFVAMWKCEYMYTGTSVLATHEYTMWQ